MKGKGQPSGAYQVWWFKLIFITQMPCVCARESVCAFKPTKAWAEQKKCHLRIICMTPPARWNFKEPLRSACLCLPQGKGSKEFFFHSACPSRCALKGGKMGRCDSHGGQNMPGHRPPLHTLKASKPPAFRAHALSIQQALWEMPGKSQQPDTHYFFGQKRYWCISFYFFYAIPSTESTGEF